MKTTMIYSLILLTLLGLGIGCKKEVEEVKPPVVVGPPTSTTTPPVATTVISSTAIPLPNYDFVVQPPANCRFTKLIFKAVNNGTFPVVDPETVTADGASYTVSKEYEVLYSYDQLGRLVQTDYISAGGSKAVRKYEYTSQRIFRSFFPDLSIQGNKNHLDTIPLNGRGLSTGPPDYHLIEYDAEGFPVRYLNNGKLAAQVFVEQSNIVKYASYVGSEFGTGSDTTLYFLSRPNLPNLYPFLGKSSKNLVARNTTSMIGSTLYPNGNVYQLNYYYTFNEKGLATRVVRHGIKLNQNWPFTPDGGAINITYYEYSCP